MKTKYFFAITIATFSFFLTIEDMYAQSIQQLGTSNLEEVIPNSKKISTTPAPDADPTIDPMLFPPPKKPSVRTFDFEENRRFEQYIETNQWGIKKPKELKLLDDIYRKMNCKYNKETGQWKCPIIRRVVSYEKTLNVCNEPDLTPKVFAIEWTPDSRFAVVVVENIGCKKAGQFEVYVEINATPIIRQGERRIFTETVSHLNAGEREILLINLDPDGRLGNVDINNFFVRVDTEKIFQVQESDESNNEKYFYPVFD